MQTSKITSATQQPGRMGYIIRDKELPDLQIKSIKELWELQGFPLLTRRSPPCQALAPRLGPKIPSPQHIEGFLLGCRHMIRLARRFHFAGASGVRMTMTMAAEYRDLSRRAKKIDHRSCARPGTLAVLPPPDRARNPDWLMLGIRAAIGLALALVFSLLLLRGILIEQQERHDTLCRYYAAEVNAFAASKGQPPPCPKKGKA